MAVLFDWNEKEFNKLIDNCPSEPVTPYLHKYLTKEGNIQPYNNIVNSTFYPSIVVMSVVIHGI